ncbi:MAG: AraC family transcriptional regulator ligand-binding domain-containing protein [Pseudomonadota bacterium]
MTATLVAFALARGMTLAEIEAATGLDGTTLGDPDARLDDSIPGQIWVALSERTPPNVALSVEATRWAPLSALADFVHGTQFAPTLRDALGFLRDNRSHIADRLDVQLVEAGDHTAIAAHHPNDIIDRGRISEMGAGLIARLVREILGVQTPPVYVEILSDPMGPAEAYESFFRCPVHFNTGRMALVFDNATLSRPVKSGNPELFEFVVRHFRNSLKDSEAHQNSPDLDRLRQAIADGAACGDYRVSSVVIRSGLSERTAQRVAASHGMTIKQMIADTRKSAAEALLADASVTTEKIATMLGFSDDRAFRRAFKRWSGQSPSQYRRARVFGA